MTPALPHTLPGEKLILGLLSPTTEQGASHLNTHELCSDPCTASPLLSPHLLPSCPPSEQERGLVWPLLLTMELWRLETCVFPGKLLAWNRHSWGCWNREVAGGQRLDGLSQRDLADQTR